MASNSSNWKVSMDVFESETGSLLDSIVTAVKKNKPLWIPAEQSTAIHVTSFHLQQLNG